MLLVETYLSESPITAAGRGLFCRNHISAGTIIWEYTKGFDYVVKKLPSLALHRLFVRKYGYMPLEGPDQWIMCADDARFMNHSEDPTCLDTGKYTTARFDLPAGTELTSDYRTFCRDPFADFEPSH
jgi:uncharacterized protein